MANASIRPKYEMWLSSDRLRPGTCSKTSINFIPDFFFWAVALQISVQITLSSHLVGEMTLHNIGLFLNAGH
jgi:hypothetical protein